MIMGAELMGGLDNVTQNGESPEFVGRVIAALFQDPERLTKTGKIWSTRKLAEVNI